PTDRREWARIVARVHEHTRKRDEIATIVGAQQLRRGAPRAAVEAAARLADPRAVAIVTGQQAGLFGGPLYTLLKALTAIKLARQVSREQNVPAVAVFWVEAEDHDWDEVRSTIVFDEKLEARTIELPAQTRTDPIPVARITLDDSIAAAI